MAGDSYVLSFTAGALLYHESITVAETYRKTNDWSSAQTQVLDRNLLQSRIKSTSTRKLREICKRLANLTTNQIELLVLGSRAEQNMLLWLACCKRYQLIGEFAKELLREKFLKLDFSISALDVEQFMKGKSLWHDELEQVTENTIEKLQTVILRMLRESELISTENIILPKLFSQNLVRVIAEDDIEQFAFFPVTEIDIKGILDAR